ncbi:MAG: glycosyltransferase [Campylobacterales bacterium]
MKILELEASLGWGGQEQRSVRLVNNLPQEVKIYWGVSQESEIFRRRYQIRGHFFPVEIRKSYDLKAIFRLARFVQREGIDLISTHSGKDGWVGAVVGKLTGTKVVRTRHLVLPIRSPVSYNWSNRVVAVSRQVAEELKRGGVKPEKIEVIYTGIETDRFKPDRQAREELRRRWGVAPNQVVVGIVAVLREAKRHRDLIEAVAPLRDVKLVIAGEGPQRRNLERLVEEIGIGKRVLFLGEVKRVEKLYPAFDIFALPSWHEALGTSLLEAQSCQLPVVATAVGGIPEAVLDRKTGFLVEPLNPTALREKLKILVKNPNLRTQFGEKGREWVLKNFSIEQMVHRTLSLYNTLYTESKQEW